MIQKLKAFWASLPHIVQAGVVLFVTTVATTIAHSIEDGVVPHSWADAKHLLGTGIVAGVYPVKLTMSPHFGYVTPEVLNVPNRTNIRIHRGNEPIDSLGCTLVGESAGPQPDWINDSQATFGRLMDFCRAAEARGEEITVEYHDPAQPQAYT